MPNIRGTISYYLPDDPLSSSMLRRAVVCEVIIANEVKYFLRYEFTKYGKHYGAFQIYDAKSKDKLGEWPVEQKRLKTIMALPEFDGESPIIQFGGTPKIITGGRNSQRLTLELKGTRRIFKLNKTSFMHEDYDSHIQFQSPKDNVFCALVLGMILFVNPQGMEES